MTGEDSDAFEYYDDRAHREPGAGVPPRRRPERSHDMSPFGSQRRRPNPSGHWLTPTA